MDEINQTRAAANTADRAAYRAHAEKGDVAERRFGRRRRYHHRRRQNLGGDAAAVGRRGSDVPTSGLLADESEGETQ